MSDDHLARWKTYFYPGTEVLINKFGCQDAVKLARFESGAVAYRTIELRMLGISGNGDLEHMQVVHRHLFQDTYEWAGQLRDVPMAKGASTSFDRPEDLTIQARRIHARLVADGALKERAKPAFVQRLAAYCADMNKVHPFREGNGRVLRYVMQELAQRAGYTLDQVRIDKTLWNAASAQSMGGDTRELQRIVAEAVRPNRAVALERLSRDNAIQAHPELRPIYALLDAARERLLVEHPGNAKAQAHFLAHRRSELVRRLDAGEVLANIAQQSPPQLRSQPATAVPAKYEGAWRKAQQYAADHLAEPLARMQFLARFQERIWNVERHGMPVQGQRESGLGR